LTTSHNLLVKSMHRNSSLQSGLLHTYQCLDLASSYLRHTPTTNTRSGTEADDDAPRQIDQSKFCILYSIKILSQHYRKPQINTNFVLPLHKIQEMISRLRVLIVVPLKNQAFLDVTMCQIITIYLSQQHNTISHLVLYKQHHYKAHQFYTTQIHFHRVYTRYWTLIQSCGIKPFTNVSNNRKYDCYVSCW